LLSQFRDLFHPLPTQARAPDFHLLALGRLFQFGPRRTHLGNPIHETGITILQSRTRTRRLTPALAGHAAFASVNRRNFVAYATKFRATSFLGREQVRKEQEACPEGSALNVECSL
jgi:hypothetical protein